MGADYSQCNYANSDFLEAGYESVKKMRQMRKWPRFLRKLKFSVMKKLVYSQYANAIGDDNFMDEYTFEDFENSIFSHVYDKSFMENRILSCGRCIKTGASEAVVCDEKFIWKFLNINGEYTGKSFDSLDRDLYWNYHDKTIYKNVLNKINQLRY